VTSPERRPDGRSAPTFAARPSPPPAGGATPGAGGRPDPAPAAGARPTEQSGPPATGPGRRAHRDRHGRGLRGRLVPATVPLARTKAEIFDDLVLDTVEALERRYAKELAGVEFAVEEVPPELNVYDSDVLEDGEVPLARLLPGRQAVPPRIVLYRRPLEFRAIDREDLADLIHDVVIEQVANLLGVDPDELA
jgi:predicted Zn-dependent protease with MMP-like domain